MRPSRRFRAPSRVSSPHRPPFDHSSRTEDAAAAAICLALVGVGLALGRAHLVPGYGVETDFVGAFSVQANNLLHGRPYTYPYHPLGYSALLALLIPGTGDGFTAGKVLSALAAGLFAATTYLLLRRLADRALALATTALLAVLLIPYSYLAASDLVGAAIAQVALLVLLTGPGPSGGRLLAVGIVAGLAYLVRTTGALVLGPAAVAVLLLDVGARRRRRPKLLAALAAGFVIGTLPSLLYNWLTLGQPFGPTAYVQAGLSFRTAASGDVATSESAVVGVGSVLRVLTAHPVEFAGRYVRRLVEEAGPLVTLQGLGFPLVLFVGVGLILLARRASARTWIYIGYCVMGYLVVGLLDPLIRYYLFLLPLLCLAGALGILLAAGEAGNATERARLLAWGLLAATGALTLRTSLGQVRRALSDDPRGLQPIAERLRRLARPGDVVLARKPNLAYLAGLTDIPIVGDETLGQALQEGRARGARFLLYSPAEAEFWPPLRELATPSMAPPETRAVLVDPATNIVIYELLH